MSVLMRQHGRAVKRLDTYLEVPLKIILVRFSGDREIDQAAFVSIALEALFLLPAKEREALVQAYLAQSFTERDAALEALREKLLGPKV
jgi:hypothetical protein